MLNGETLADYVERRIQELFLDVAEIVNQTPGETLSPMAIMMAEGALITAWRKFVRTVT